MLKIGKMFLALLLLGYLITGCNQTSEKVSFENGSTLLKIKTSNYPFYYLTQRIAGDKADVESIIQLGVDPHSWEPTPEDLVDLEKAHILFCSGVGMEEWVGNITAAINSKELAVLSVTQDIHLLSDEGEVNEKHEELHHDEHNRDLDPHVWLDPINCIIISRNIKEAVIEKDPDNKEYYENNYKQLLADLNKLDSDFKSGLNNIKKKEFVVNHAAFGYLAKRYGLTQIPVMGINPHTEPTPTKMIEIVELLRKNNLNCIFTETIINSKAAEVLAKEAGIKTRILNPLGNLTKEDIQAGKDFLNIMYENLEALKSALQ
ncbi:MAG: metal ABC transporter solute-binding protein, Zn/Mn family [Bacillota bacterium]